MGSLAPAVVKECNALGQTQVPDKVKKDDWGGGGVSELYFSTCIS